MSTAFDASSIEVQEQIFFLELPPGAQPVSERGLREALLGTIDWEEQRRRWEGLKTVAGIDTPARNPRS
jgi:hypothetical protein